MYHMVYLIDDDLSRGWARDFPENGIDSPGVVWHTRKNMIDESSVILDGEAGKMVALLQVLVAGLVTGSLYGLLALGITLIYRTTGVLNFAYGTIAALCACFMAVLLLGPVRNFALAFVLALIFAALLGMVLERGFARPVLEAPV